MNTFKNLLQKVKALLKEDDQLTKEQCTVYQWQLLTNQHDVKFVVGKGGVNTIFYTASDSERSVCYPDEILELLKTLAEGNVQAYLALGKNKEQLGYSVHIEKARQVKKARYIAELSHEGKITVIESKVADLLGNKIWQSNRKKKKAKK